MDDDTLPANRYELRMRGEATTTYASAQRAAAAFHAAAAARQPSVHRFARSQPQLQMAKTSLRAADYGVPDQLLWRKEVDAVLREGERFRQAYYAAVESSLRMRLEAVDNWAKVEPRLGNGMVWQLDRALYDDLETLAFARPENAIQAWMDHVGTRYDAPTFVDRDTGQVVTLADTANVSAARHLHEYRFGVPLEARHTPARPPDPSQEQAAAQAPAPAQSDAQGQPPTQAQWPGKEQKVNEQHQGAPAAQVPVAATTEQANSVEPASGPSHAIDGTPVEFIRFSRRGKGDDMVFDLRGFNGQQQVIEARGVPVPDLSRVVGEEAAQKILQADKRTGTLTAGALAGVPKPLGQAPGKTVPRQPEATTPEPKPTHPTAGSRKAQPTAAAQASSSPDSHGLQDATTPRPQAPVIADPEGVKARRDAEQLAIEAIKASLQERFIVRIGREPETTEYRFRGEPGVLAFVDMGARLTTDRQEADVARGIVDLAQAKGWKALRLNGSEDFRRNVWREAAVRGLPATGYVATKADQEWVVARLNAQQGNTAQRVPVQPLNAVERSDSSELRQPAQAAAPLRAQGKATGTASAQQGPTKEQSMAAMRAALQELDIDQASRQRVLTRLSARLDALLAQGRPLPELARYDRTAASHMAAFVPKHAQQQGLAQQVGQTRAARAR